MRRALLNFALGAGYVLGTLFVWIGIEMVAIDGARLAPGVLSVAVGIGCWSLLSTAGRALRTGMHAGADGA